MSEVSIRPAVLSEQWILEELQRRASLNNPGDREAILAHPDAIELPPEQIEAGGVFVLEKGAEIAGFAVILPRNDGWTELDGLFVDPRFQRHGFGRSLVEHCAGVALRHGSPVMHVIGNHHAEPFYVKCGFRTTGVAKTRFGDALQMERKL
jgi:GNAT superfamily N-acetyltransferase